jgi:hypothetical protein
MTKAVKNKRWRAKIPVFHAKYLQIWPRNGSGNAIPVNRPLSGGAHIGTDRIQNTDTSKYRAFQD